MARRKLALVPPDPGPQVPVTCQGHPHVRCEADCTACPHGFRLQTELVRAPTPQVYLVPAGLCVHPEGECTSADNRCLVPEDYLSPEHPGPYCEHLRICSSMTCPTPGRVAGRPVPGCERCEHLQPPNAAPEPEPAPAGGGCVDPQTQDPFPTGVYHDDRMIDPEEPEEIPCPTCEASTDGTRDARD